MKGFFRPSLALAVAVTAVGAHLASPWTGAATPQRHAHSSGHRSVLGAGAALKAATRGFGYAVTHPRSQPIDMTASVTDAADSFAASSLLKQAPAHHIVNLLGLMNTPTGYTAQLPAQVGTTATVTYRWAFGATRVVDLLAWSYSGASWHITSASYLRTDVGGPREQVDLAMSGFANVVIHGPDAMINTYGTRALLRRAPGHHLINALHLPNVPTDSAYRIVSVSETRAVGIMIWGFGTATNAVFNRIQWVKEPVGWRIAGVTRTRG